MTFFSVPMGLGSYILYLESDRGEVASFCGLLPEEPEPLAWLRLKMIWSALCLGMAAGIAESEQLSDLAEVAFGWEAKDVSC